MTAPGIDQYEAAVGLVQMIEANYAADMTVDELLRLAQVKATLGLTAATVLFGAAMPEDGPTVHEWRKVFCAQAPARRGSQKSQRRGSSVASRTDL